MAKKYETWQIALGLIILVGAVLFLSGGLQFAAVPGVPGVPPTAPPGFATNIRVSGYDPIAGSLTNINAELWTSDHTQSVAETQANAALTSITSTGANTFDGYLLVGNDDYESSTDRGTEYYYNKKTVSWVNKAGDVPFDRIATYAEGTPTWTGYDDGTAETNTNISVGSGATVTTTELRIEPSSNALLGNPQFNRPLAVCFNESTAGLFEEIRPASYDEIIPAPGFLSGRNIIKSECYVLPTTALYEGVSGQPQFYRFYIRIEAKAGQNPAAGASNDQSYAILLDKTYWKDDNQVWQVGFGDESIQTADTDVGMAAIGNEKQIGFT